MNITNFLLVSVLLTLSPGPDVLFVFSQSLVKGARVGLFVVTGLISGVFLHTTLSAFGLSLLLSRSHLGFFVVKCLGVFWLIYLGMKAWQQRHAKGFPSGENKAITFWHSFRTGFLMSCLNPKLLIFFLAFLPQFITGNPETARRELFFLGFLFALQAFFLFSLVAVFAARLAKKWREHPSVSPLLHIMTAFVLFAIALSLCLTNF